MARVLEDPADETRIREVRVRTRELCEEFPLYPELRAGVTGGRTS
jgi:hypothetical protein